MKSVKSVKSVKYLHFLNVLTAFRFTLAFTLSHFAISSCAFCPMATSPDAIHVE